MINIIYLKMDKNNATKNDSNMFVYKPFGITAPYMSKIKSDRQKPVTVKILV